MIKPDKSLATRFCARGSFVPELAIVTRHADKDRYIQNAVCLGHRDPDLFTLNRQAPTPNPSSEHVLYYIDMIVAGANGR